MIYFQKRTSDIPSAVLLPGACYTREKPAAATLPHTLWRLTTDNLLDAQQEASLAWQFLVLMDSMKKRHLPQPPMCDRKAQEASARPLVMNYSEILITSVQIINSN